MRTILAFIGACFLAAFLLGSIVPGAQFSFFFGSDEGYARFILGEVGRIHVQGKP